MTFDPKWPHGHITRDGRKARIISTDATVSYDGVDNPIIALVSDGPRGNENVYGFAADGRYLQGREIDLDLINAPEKVERFAPIYISGDSAYRSSLDEAKALASRCRSGFVKFTFIDGNPVSAEIVEDSQ